MLYNQKIRKAVQSGNWSSPTTWNEGIKPVPGDIVCSNTYDVTIDENVNVYHITTYTANTRRAKVTPDMYSNAEPSDVGIVVGYPIGTQVTYSSGDRELYRLFDSSVGSGDRCYNDRGIGYKFNTPTIIKAFSYTQGNTSTTRYILDFTLEASNDEENWVVLDTVVNCGYTYSNYSLENSTAYTYYRIFWTAVGSYGSGYVGDLSLFDVDQSSGYILEDSITEGGGYFIGDNVTITCTDPVIGISGVNDGRSIFEYSGSASSTINANFIENQCRNYHNMILHSGTGTLNIVGDNPDRYPLTNSANTTIYMRYNERYGSRVGCTNSGTTNLIGNIGYNHTFGSERQRGFYITGDHTFNIVGDIYYGGYYGQAEVRQFIVLGSTSSLNITGDIELVGGQGSATDVILLYGDFTMTGEIVSNFNNVNFNEFIRIAYYGSNVASIYDHIGKVQTNIDNRSVVFSVDRTALMSGPFICGPYGAMPFAAEKMRLRNNYFVNNYFEFRDEAELYSTFPSPEPNKLLLVSPDTNIPLPSESDVRKNVSYGISYVGTLAVPSPNQVSYGIPTDNTVGTAVLTPEDVWNAQTSAMNTDGSIGKRLKNTATVQSTGDQLSALL